MRKFSLALLADDTPIEAETSGTDSEVVTAEIAADPSPDIAAADETADTAVSSVDTIDGADADAEALDQVADLVDTANENGGLDPVAAESIKILTNRIRANLGMSPITGIAIENFKSKTTRVKAGQLAKESIQSTAKAIWDYIVKLWDKLVAWLKKWYNNFFDGITKLKNRAVKVVKAAENKEGDKFEGGAEARKLAGPAYANHLALSKADAGAARVATSKEIAEYWTTVADTNESDTSSDISEVILGDAQTLLEKVNDPSKFKESAKAIFDAIKNSGVGAPLKGSNFDIEDGFEMKAFGKATGPKLGEKGIFIKYPKSMDGDFARALGKVRIVVMGDTGRGTATNLDMVAAEPEEVKIIAEKIRDTAEMVLRDRAKMEKVATSVKSFTDATKRVAAKYKDEAAERAGQVRAVASATHSFITGSMVAANQIILTCGHASLTFCADSLNALGKTEKEKPEDSDALKAKKDAKKA